MRYKKYILLIFAFMTIGVMADNAYSSKANEFRSTSIMRVAAGGNANYRSSYGSRYTGSYSQSVPQYKVGRMSQVSQRTYRSYSSAYGSSSYYRSSQGGSVTDVTGGLGMLPSQMSFQRNNFRVAGDVYSRYLSVEQSGGIVRRRSGGINDWFEELLNDYIAEHGIGFVYTDDGYNYYNQDWLNGLYDLWRELYGEGATPDLFAQMMEDKRWRATQQETLPIGEGMWFMLLLAMVYVLNLLRRKINKTVMSNIFEMNKLNLLVVLLTTSIMSVNAICYIPNDAGISSAINGEPVLSFYINPNSEFGIEMPTAFNTDDKSMAQMMAALLMSQVSNAEELMQSLFNPYQDNDQSVMVPAVESFRMLLQFPDMRDMIAPGVGIYITPGRYMCTFEQLFLPERENYSTRYYLADIVPARLLYLTPDGLTTLNIASDDAQNLINAVQPWLPTTTSDLFNTEGCTKKEMEVYAVLPDLYKTMGTKSGYYRLTFKPDDSNIPQPLGDGQKNGYYYLSDMELLSVLPPLKYDGNWQWAGEYISCEQTLLQALPKPTAFGSFQKISVNTDLSKYLPCMTKGNYLLKFDESHQLTNYAALLTKTETEGFPANNELNSVFAEDGTPLMDALFVLEDNVAKLYLNMSGKGLNGYAAMLYENMSDENTSDENTSDIRFMYDYHESFLPPMLVSDIKTMMTMFGLDTQHAPKIYLTGVADNVYSGGTESEGLLFIRGSENEEVHLYLENFTVNSMQDTEWDMTFGSVFGLADIDKMLYMRKSQHNSVFDLLMDGLGTRYTRGASSVLAFGSSSIYTDRPFKVNIHSKGENTLTGGAQSYFTPYSIEYLNNNAVANCIVKMLLDLDIDVLVNIFAKGITRMVASPISVRPYSYRHDADGGMSMEYMLKSATRLTFDDYWIENGEPVRKYGKLNLPIKYDTEKGECEYDHSAPSIDYGTALGQVVFNGGQYRLTTAAKTSTALSTGTHAIANRAVDFEVNLSLLGSTFPGKVTLPNTGTSIGRGEEKDARSTIDNVVIENGTFSTYSAEEFKGYYDVVANGVYYSYDDLRLPYSSQINGGSFASDVYRVSDATQRGLTPIRSFGSNDTIALCRQDRLFADLPTDQTYIEIDDVVSSKQNKYQYRYNIDGLFADEEGVVHLYLPCDDQDVDMSDSYTQNYTTLFPLLGIQGLMEVGGPVDVFTTYKGVEDGVKQTNAYLMQYVPNMSTIENAQITIGGIRYSMSDVMPEATREEDRWAGSVRKSGVLSSEPNAPDPHEDYTIAYGMYMMRSFTGNQWYMFSPPYDVAKVYVVETHNIDYKDASLFHDDNAPAYVDYLNKQAASESQMLDVIFNQLVPDVTNTGASGSGPLLDFVSFLRNIDGVRVTELVHYNPNLEGHGSADANYFLYQSVGDESSVLGEWPLMSDVKAYADFYDFVEYENNLYEKYVDQNNQPLPDVDQRFLMHTEDIYTFFLPEGKDRFYDNKYLLFEGYGPQQIRGANYFENYYNESILSGDEDYIYFQGNTTFTNYVIENADKKWRLDNNGQNMYTLLPLTDDHIVHTGEVYAVAESVTKPLAMPQFGNIDSGEQLPHANQIKLFVWDEQGIMLRSLAEQNIEIITSDGRTLWRGCLVENQTTRIPATSGVYMVRSEDQTMKIIVK